jgi:hypothetical protein
MEEREIQIRYRENLSYHIGSKAVLVHPHGKAQH